MNIISSIKKIPIGTVLPKPKAKADFKIASWGKRREKPALIYSIPNHKNSAKPYKKGINIDEWEMAYTQLTSTGKFSRKWFNNQMSECAYEGGCNFTTIGSVFILLGLAEYQRSEYIYL